MAGRGPQTFNKRQKEQRRKEWQEEKLERRLERKRASKPEENADKPKVVAFREQPRFSERP